jgi:hypothetical protein
MLYDILTHRATGALVIARPAGSPWSAIERATGKAAPFRLRRRVELTDEALAALYPPPPDEEPEPVAEAVEPAAAAKAVA